MNEHEGGNHTTDSSVDTMLAGTEHPASFLQENSGDHRIELYARLRNVIDSAIESIRILKQENAALEGEVADISRRNQILEQRLRAATVDLEGDERALRQSAEMLAQLLGGEEAMPPGLKAWSQSRRGGDGAWE